MEHKLTKQALERLLNSAIHIKNSIGMVIGDTYLPESKDPSYLNAYSAADQVIIELQKVMALREKEGS